MATTPRMDLILDDDVLFLDSQTQAKPKHKKRQCLFCQDNSIYLAEFFSLLYKDKLSSRSWNIY